MLVGGVYSKRAALIAALASVCFGAAAQSYEWQPLNNLDQLDGSWFGYIDLPIAENFDAGLPRTVVGLELAMEYAAGSSVIDFTMIMYMSQFMDDMLLMLEMTGIDIEGLLGSRAAFKSYIWNMVAEELTPGGAVSGEWDMAVGEDYSIRAFMRTGVDDSVEGIYINADGSALNIPFNENEALGGIMGGSYFDENLILHKALGGLY
jgi:hypothetical protein